MIIPRHKIIVVVCSGVSGVVEVSRKFQENSQFSQFLKTRSVYWYTDRNK